MLKSAKVCQFAEMEMPPKYSPHVQNADFQGAQEQLEDQVSKEDMHVPEKQTGTSVSIYRTSKSNSSASNISFLNKKGDKSQLTTEGSQEKEGYAKICAGASQSTSRCSSIKTTAGGIGSYTSLMRLGPRLRAEGLMVPPAPDAATLRCQLAALQTDLEARIDAEKKLQSFNQQLQERLELYMKQSHENLQRAALEMNTLHEDMEQTLELEHRLAQRALTLEREKKGLEEALEQHVHDFENEREFLQAQQTSLLQVLSERSEAEAHTKALQVKLEEIMVTNAKLQEKIQQNHTEAKYLKLKAEEYNNNIDTLIKKEQIGNIVENRCRRAILQHFLLKLREGFNAQRINNKKAKDAVAFKDKIYSRHGFRALHEATKRAKYIRVAETNRKEMTLQESFKAWQFFTTLIKRSEKVTKAQAQSCICKAFSRWKKVVSTEKPDHEYQSKIVDIAVNHYRGNICKRFWEEWLQWISYSARPRKLKLAAVKRRIIGLICRQMFSAWRCAICIIRVKRVKLQQASYQQKHWLFTRSILRWKEFLNFKQFRDYLSEKASHFRQLHIWRAALTSWQKNLGSRKHKKLSQLLAFRHYLQILKFKGITVWRQNTKYQQSQLRATLEFNQALTRAAFVFWRDYHILQAMKKNNEKRAMAHEKRKEKKSLKAFFFWWWDLTTWKIWAKQFEHLYSIRGQRSVLLAILHCWMHRTFKRAFETHINVQNQLIEVQAYYKEQNHQKSTIDLENLQLTERIHTMSLEIEFLKMHLSERQKREEELHHTLEDGANVESSIRCELEHQRLLKTDLEKQIVNMQKHLQVKNSDDATGEVHHILEIQNLDLTLKDLRSKLAQRSCQIESYEKALKETVDRLEGASDESCNKLSNAFEIAASLRKLLEIRENQFSMLEERAKIRDSELGEIQKKYAIANSTFSNTLETREARIHDLDHLIAMRQAEVQEAQLDLQDLQVSLDAKEIYLKKLEYELKFNCGVQDPVKRNLFIAKLSSWPQANNPHDVPSPVQDNLKSAGLAEMFSKRTSACAMPTASIEKLIQCEKEKKHQTECPFIKYNKKTQYDQPTISLGCKEVELFCPETKSPRPERCPEDKCPDWNLVRGMQKATTCANSDETQEPSSSRTNQRLYCPMSDSLNEDWKRPAKGLSKIQTSQTIGEAEVHSPQAQNTINLRRPDGLFVEHLVTDHLQGEIQHIQARALDHLNDASMGMEELQTSSSDSTSSWHIQAFRRKLHLEHNSR